MKVKFILFFLLTSTLVFSQLNQELKEESVAKWTKAEVQKFTTADKYFANEEYLFARQIYDSLYKKHSSNIYLGYLLGTCSIYDAHYQQNATSLILAAESIKTKLVDYDFYLGKAYLVNDKFEEAITYFEKYKSNPLNKIAKDEVDYQISVCENAVKLNSKSAVVKITNIGAPINTAGSEYTPIFSSKEDFIAYTYRGERSMGGKQIVPNKVDIKNGIYFEDVMMSVKKKKKNWQEPKPINALNTNGHDAVVHISHDGQKMFIYRNVGVGAGDIYISKLNGLNWSVPEKVKGINSNYWEGSVCLSPDEKTMYFSSERPGGLGGRDLYFAKLLPDGSWGNVKNLGPEINTEKDEDSPFIHSDGKILFFSSTGHNSIGGYDIFRSNYKMDKWEAPYNIGKPVNTSQDDKFYVVSVDGERGYYSSEKKSGQGMQDIYVVEPGLFGKPTALVMVTGKVTFDNAPINASVLVRSKFYKKDFSGTFNSNSITGNYLINLPSGNEYEVVFKHLNKTVVKSISTTKIDSFARIEIDAELFSDEYAKLNDTKLDSTVYKSEVKNNTNAASDQLLTKYGNTVIDSLFYTIQIGAYKIPENFNYAKLIGLPKAERKSFSDNITRFTIGMFSKLVDTNELLIKAKKNGINDAFIIAIYKGERYFLNDLIKLQIFK